MDHNQKKRTLVIQSTLQAEERREVEQVFYKEAMATVEVLRKDGVRAKLIMGLDNAIVETVNTKVEFRKLV